MKKIIALALGLLLCMAAMAAGEALVSRSYLEGAFSQALDAAINPRLDASDETLRARLGASMPEREPDAAPASGMWELKEGDVLSGYTGMSVTLLGGEVQLKAPGGAVVDVTEGTEVYGGHSLCPDHRYIVAENTAAAFTVTSAAAVLYSEGGGTLTASDGPDYYALARALRTLGLFQGSGSGIGEGFDLHLAPTRGEGLVMFLRILGEEDAALAYTGTHPFTDVPGWLDRYVAWAWAQGYANGVAPGLFGGGQTLSAVEYEEFLLRALGYSRAGVDDYATSLERALNCGALTSGEYVMLREEPFLRAQVAYISYHALDLPVGGGSETLAQRLTAAGALTAEQLAQAKSQITSDRIF